jgi:signal transduction histidine kinase
VQIRTRLTLRFTILVSAIVLVSFLVIYALAHQFIQQEFYSRLNDKAVTSAILLLKVQEVDSALLKVIDRAKRDMLNQQFVKIYNPEGELLYNSADSVLFTLSPGYLTQIKTNKLLQFKLNEYEMVGFKFRDQSRDYVVVGGAVDTGGRQQLRNLKRLLMVLFVVMILIVGYAGWVFSARALRPINKVISDAKNLSPHTLGLRLTPAAQQDEIGKLISIINEQLARIEAAFNLQKMFVANVSHELNNPLTKITSQLEVTLFKPRPLDEYQKTIESVLEDIRELNQLSASLLELARIAQNENTFVRQQVRLDEILWDVRDSLQAMDARYVVGVEIRDMPDDDRQLCVIGNPYLIKVALRNMVENACKFSANHRAHVTLQRTHDQLTVSIADKGIGMKPSDIAHIFQPFFRTDASSKIKGHGVGLSLSHRIIAIHHGQIHVDSALGVGTLVTVSLPGVSG